MPKVTLAELAERTRQACARASKEFVESGAAERVRAEAEAERLARIKLGEIDEEGNSLLVDVEEAADEGDDEQ
uniref:Uncharacterized protein n=1 Tax=Caulobacter phage BL57 TaxID=3348355 RepID=A0AB74UGV4_9VIRU